MDPSSTFYYKSIINFLCDRSGLLKLHLENLSNLNPDPWYSAYHYTHPPLLERQRAIKRAIDVRERKAH
jgi:hypothetical protein